MMLGNNGKDGLIGRMPASPGFEDLCTTARCLFGVSDAFVSLTDASGWFDQVSIDLSAMVAATLGATAGSERVLVVADALRDERFRPEPSRVGGPPVRFFAGAPVILSSGLRAGVLCVVDARPNALSDLDVVILERMAAAVAERLEAAGRRGEAARQGRGEAARQGRGDGHEASSVNPELGLQAAYDRLLQAERIAHVGHWELRFDPPSRKWSGEVRRIFGIGPDDPVPDLGCDENGYHPADRERVREALRAAIDRQEEFEFETRIVRPCGKQREIVVRGICETDMGGRSTCLFGVCIDVTEIKETERRLREAEGRFRLLVESVSDYAITMLDPNGDFSAWNASAERMTGYAADEIVGRNFSVFHTEMDRELGLPEQSLRTAITDGRHKAEGWRIRRDGSRFWGSVSITPMRDDDGQRVGFAMVTRDVTDRKAMQDQLIEKSILLDRTMQNMDQGLLLIDDQERVTLYNQRAVKLLGLPDELMRTKPRLAETFRFQQAHGEFAKTSADELRRAGYGLQPSTFSVYERERPDGTMIEIRTVRLDDGGAVRTITDVTARKRAERLAEHMARHDDVTGLPNRPAFEERLRAELNRVGRSGGTCAVLYLDLDRFKPVNDTFGHLAGDGLLREVAERITATVAPSDFAARIGGDEFAVVAPDGSGGRDAEALAGDLIRAIREPFQIHRLTVNVGLSVGIATAPRDGMEPEHLLKNADLALYRAKAGGRKTYRVYDPAVDQVKDDLLLLEMDIGAALADGQFRLHYQPIVGARSGRVTGCEALLRWQHPRRGLVSPATFIPLAEETGLIVPIGAWALREACRTAATWTTPARIAVNVSVVQFRGDGLEEAVVTALASSGLAPDRLELEITESVLMADSDAVLRRLTRLRSLGVRIALDDFGTGYSSLSYLHRFPLDKIKIDRSFIARIEDPDTCAIVQAIVDLGRRRGSAITAEGVETEEQFGRVAQVGCTEVQGFHVGGPMPSDQLTAAFKELGAPITPGSLSSTSRRTGRDAAYGPDS